MGNECLVSVIIPSYHSDSTIGRTLNAVSTQEGEFGYETIVVNSSEDSTPDIIRDNYPHVKLIQLDERTPPGRARNVGAGTACGRYLSFLDSDCIVECDWLKQLIYHYSDEYCAIGGPIENANPDSLISRAGYILEFSDFLAHGSRRGLNHIPAGNLMLPKETFESINGFPEEYSHAQEDRLFSWQLTQKTSKKLLFHPGIGVKHHHRTDLKDYLIHQYNIGRGGAEILKHSGYRGSGIINRKWLVNLLLPAFPLVKLSRCLCRTLRWRPEEIWKEPQILLLLDLGMLFWTIGFAKQANTGR
jgi:GT2 family glycosyltransferase